LNVEYFPATKFVLVPSIDQNLPICSWYTKNVHLDAYTRVPALPLRDKDETIGNVPHYNELGTIGMSILSSQLRNYADIKSSSHHVNIASNDFRFLQDLVPEQAHKNSGKEIQSILNGVVGKSCEEIRSYYNSKSELEQEIWVGPSGGSLVKAGSTPLGMKQKEDTDAIAKKPSCMNPNASEQRFIDAVRYRAVVVLHAPER
jgi:hypothetical protein